MTSTNNYNLYPSDPKKVIEFYQVLGFYSNMDPTDILKEFEHIEGYPPIIQEPWDDVYLLAFAPENEVLLIDPECVMTKGKMYIPFLPELARISHGTFSPSDITESWGKYGPPIHVSFRLNEFQVSIAPHYYADWVDLDILKEINLLIKKSGREFACVMDGNFALITCITPEQKAALKAVRKFPFDW